MHSMRSPLSACLHVAFRQPSDYKHARACKHSARYHKTLCMSTTSLPLRLTHRHSSNARWLRLPISACHAITISDTLPTHATTCTWGSRTRSFARHAYSVHVRSRANAPLTKIVSRKPVSPSPMWSPCSCTLSRLGV